MKKDAYACLLTQAQKEEQIFHKSFNQISRWRLTSFLALVLGLVIGIYQKNHFAYALSALALAVFLLLLQQHQQVRRKKEFAQSKKEVLERYLCRFAEGWHNFAATGGEFLAAENPQAQDLDLLGKHSLYQYLCVAHTPYGRSGLAERLLNLQPQKEVIAKRQQAVQELSGRFDLCLQLQAESNLLGKYHEKESVPEQEIFLKQMENGSGQLGKIALAAMFILPALTLAVLLLVVLHMLPYPVLTVFLLGQLGLAIGGYRKNSAVVEPLFAWYKKIASYQNMMAAIEKTTWQSDLLRELQAVLAQGRGAAQDIQTLARIAEAVRLRYYPLVYLPASFLLLWDHHCAKAFLNWQRLHGRQIRRWLQTVGEIECLLSLAVLGQVRETVCFPTITEDQTPFLQGENLTHPLIAAQKAVGNPVDLKADTCLITGSNMSGKTTYLRTVGINLCLAYAGAPVCASRFTASCMKIFTSMRLTDDMSEGISTFYAELLRMKTMVAYSREQKPMLALIDEIYKGTNSADRLLGARETIKKLARPWAILLLSTHDLELCKLAADPSVEARNYHFSEHYLGNEIHFDYRLKPGVCQTTNARHLLRLAGILDE